MGGFLEEKKIAHLEMLQGIIKRMGGNSFLIKGWSVTLVSALFALAAADTNPLFAYLAYFPSLVFWALDAYFLRQERLFRRLHDKVRLLTEASIDFSMRTSEFERNEASTFKVAFSKTLLAFRGTIVGTIVIFMIVLVVCR